MVEMVQKRDQQLVSTPFDVLLSLSAESPNVANHVDPREFLSKRPMTLLTIFSEEMRAIHEIASKEPIEKVLSSIIDNLGIVAHLDKISKSDAEFNERRANVEELRRAASRHDEDGPALALPTPQEGADEAVQTPLANFLDDISLVTDTETTNSESSKNRFVLNLMTIHASKGMEFDSVYMVGLEEGTLPSIHVRACFCFD